MSEYYAGFTEEDIEFLESIGRNVDDYERRTEMSDTETKYTDEYLRRLARQLQATEEAGYVMRKRWHCSNYRHNHGWKITAWLCVLLKG